MTYVSKKTVIGLSAAFALIVGFLCFKAFSQDQRDFSRVNFSSGTSTFNFFDQGSGTLYVYGSNGRLREAWAIDELGEALVRARLKERGY